MLIGNEAAAGGLSGERTAVRVSREFEGGDA
jgi:hypothetical protein